MCLYITLSCLHVISCDQAALRTLLSVRPSVCLSVWHTFSTVFHSSYHHECLRGYSHWQEWCPCKSSRSDVKGHSHRGQINFCPNLGVSGPFLHLQMATKRCTKLKVALRRCSIVFRGQPLNFKDTWDRFWPELGLYRKIYFYIPSTLFNCVHRRRYSLLQG